MKMNVFGKIIEILPEKDGWAVCYVGSEGKKRPASDLIIPPELEEHELLDYLADLCHEWATEKNSRVFILK